MKVVIYSGAIPSTTFIERLIIGLAESDVKVILHGQIHSKLIKYDSKNIKVIGYRNKISKLLLTFKYIILFDLTQPFQLFRLIQYYFNQNIDSSFVNWFARVAPIIWHKPDIFHLQWAKGIQDWIFLKEFGTKVVLSLRGAHINYSPIVDRQLAETYIDFFPQVDAFHGVSDAICVEAGKYSAALYKCRTIYSGLDLTQFLFEDKNWNNQAKLNIISVGRPHWKKGYHIALDAMKILADENFAFEYKIIGGKDEELIFQINDLGLSAFVSLEGKLSLDEVKNVVGAADVLLMSSVEEGIPNVILEAMALGTIVISTDCGGVAEVLKDGENGFLVPIRDARSIAEKIKFLPKISENEIEQIRRNARQTIETQHDHRRMVADMKSLYELTAKI